MCPMMHANMAMFNLISMNAVTNFPEIERLARREGEYGYPQQLSLVHKKCLFNAQEAIMHAGQILRVVREMPRAIRPPWWAGAVYRAALVLWANAFTNGDAIRGSANRPFIQRLSRSLGSASSRPRHDPKIHVSP